MRFQKWYLLALQLVACSLLQAQLPLKEELRSQTISSIKLYKVGNQEAYPVLPLNQQAGIELHFDDMQQSSRNYYYTYVLCNADWTPVNLSSMDYIRGFSQVRINQYRFSTGTQSRYVHYQATLPASNCVPSRSGNYMLKVFENSDTSKLAFSKKILVVDNKATIATAMQQPFAQDKYLTHQKVKVNVTFKNIDILNPARELKIVVMQNNRWDNARLISNPTFISGKVYEYSDENNMVFEAGKEWRWLDLRSFRLQSDRVASVNYNKTPYEVFVRPDTIRSPARYFYYSDIDGRYAIANHEPVNPWWQSDIARVHFTFLPRTPEMFTNQDIYLFGEMTQYQLNNSTRLQWNESMGVYETTYMLKNGYYNYCYVTVPKNNPNAEPSIRLTEGSMWETENDYRVLVYYTSFGSRSDELIGIAEFNSLNALNIIR